MARAFVLKPYERRREKGRFERGVRGFLLVLLAAFYGLMCSILPMQLLIVPLVPILVAFAAILWLLPDIGGVKEDWIAKCVIWFAALNVLWPSYIALNAPGLPWITPTRIVVFTLLFIFVLNYAMSAELRGRIAVAQNSVPMVRWFFWAFWGVTTFALVISQEPFFSLNKYANNQVFWTLMFVISAWLAQREGFPTRIAKVIAWSMIVVALFSLAEVRQGSPVWLPYIPSFLTVDYALLNQLSEANGRLGSAEYRSRGTFTGALYFAEYLSIGFPFVLHYAVNQKRFWGFAAVMAGLLAVMSAMFFNNSRASALALILTPVTYGFIIAWRMRSHYKQSIIATAAFFAYPVFAVLVACLVVFWRRLHVMVLGGGQHAASTQARATQWEMGLPKIAAAPWGHGAGTSGNVLGFYNPGQDNPTVDTYPLTLLLEYGVLGLVFFVGLLASVIWFGFRSATNARTPETQLLAPITAAMFNFMVIKSVASTEINLPIIMILIGCTVALVARQRREEAGPQPAVAAAVKASRGEWGSVGGFGAPGDYGFPGSPGSHGHQGSPGTYRLPGSPAGA